MKAGAVAVVCLCALFLGGCCLFGQCQKPAAKGGDQPAQGSR
ncbi:MAG: hypothetical protein U0637_10370 [Phycisphaerales bacterium]